MSHMFIRGFIFFFYANVFGGMLRLLKLVYNFVRLWNHESHERILGLFCFSYKEISKCLYASFRSIFVCDGKTMPLKSFLLQFRIKFIMNLAKKNKIKEGLLFSCYRQFHQEVLSSKHFIEEKQNN